MKKIVYLALATGLLVAESFTFSEYVPVEKSQEIYRIVTKRVPYEECWEEKVPLNQQSNEGLGTLLGGVAGGILGNQVGKGSGKTAATIGGAIVGSMVGRSLSQKNENSKEYKVVKRCRTKYQESKERIIEYKNIAKFHGQEVVKYSSKPLEYIPIRVRVEY